MRNTAIYVILVLLCTTIIFSFLQSCTSSRSSYNSRSRDIGSAALKGFVAGMRGMLEGKAESRKERQLQNVIISNSIKGLGAPNKVVSDNQHIIYYWEKLTIGIVIQHLGTPNGVRTSNEYNITLYRWGSYVFSDTPDFQGVMCIKKIE